MDRNWVLSDSITPLRVALRKESVDRNMQIEYTETRKNTSLSARRAWIEIVTRYRPTPAPVVALRKESVDRNKRRFVGQCVQFRVALRKESVDRNAASQQKNNQE